MSKPSKPAAGKTPTTEKIAFQTGAAKDERYASAINEDQTSVTLDVLANDPIVVQDSSAAESTRVIEGRLEGHDVDNGAVLTYGFAAAEGATQHEDGTVSIATAYGSLVLDSNTGEYAFTVDPKALDDLAAGQEVLLGFDVRVQDEHGAGSNIETIQFMLKGADEASESGEPQFGEETTFVVNHGLSFVNGRSVLYGFDGNDKLKLAAVKQVGNIYSVDTDGDGEIDSSALMVQFSHGNGNSGGNGNGNGNGNKGGSGNHDGGVETVEIVLSGYLGLTDDQVVSSAN